MSIETIELIAPEEEALETQAVAKPARKPAVKRKVVADPAKVLSRALETIEKLEAQNHEAGQTLHALSSIWLSADANRRRGDAEIALHHFDATLAALRKSMAAITVASASVR